MLGKTQAIANQPYSVYQGPMTAGESGLQSKVFQGLGNLSFPSQLGNTFSSTGAYQPPSMTPGAYTPGAIGTGAGMGGVVSNVVQFSRHAARPDEVACPQCQSMNTTEVSRFGSTACKAMYRCLDCMEPFDYFKPY
jgi:hypothetical protein